MSTSEERALQAVWAMWETCPNYGSKGCTCGPQMGTPARHCPVHWAVWIFEQYELDYHQTKEAIDNA